jgi:hypothetical protein
MTTGVSDMLNSQMLNKAITGWDLRFATQTPPPSLGKVLIELVVEP